MSACDFTYTHYEEIMDKIKKSNYKVTFFNESNSHDQELILRHDVDLDLESAYKMALIENKHKIRTTYFILIRSPFYNIFEKSNSDYIKGILDLGHQIGLHFDEAYYGHNDTDSMIKNVEAEVQLLENACHTNISAVSFHRPSSFLLQSDIKLKNGLINTYAKGFIKDFKYISDSRRMWKEGCLCKLLERSAEDNSIPRIQALVHPIWWTDRSMSSQDAMESFLIKKLVAIDSELEKNIQIYKKLYD